MLTDLLPALGLFLVSAITPGPNTALMLVMAAAGAPAWRLVAGASAGVAGVFAVSSLGLGALLLAQPLLVNFLRGIGAIMLLIIAWKICTAPRPQAGVRPPVAPGLVFGFSLQWVNPKLWSGVLAMITLLPQPASGTQLAWQAALVSVAGGLITCFCMSMWGLFGRLLARLVQTERAHRAFCAASALLMLVCVAAAFAVAA